jgi:urocanate hydratase
MRMTNADRISRSDVTGRLAGKVVLITGTGGGQGRVTALLFARAGAIVVGCDVKEACARLLRLPSGPTSMSNSTTWMPPDACA